MAMILKKCKSGKEKANHASTSTGLNDFFLLLLPRDLIVNILIRLPIYSIFKCKCVCKTIKNILSEPYFAKFHLAKILSSDFQLVIQDWEISSNNVLAPTLDLEKPALYSKTADHYGDNYISWQILGSPIWIPKTKRRHVVPFIIGSCNGIISFKYRVHKVDIFGVCNPILGEFTILPQPRPLTTFHRTGFGYCPKTNQYKILRYFSQDGNCEILTLGTDKWRMINDLPRHLCDGTFFSSYKGNIHWIVNYMVRDPICSFSLEREQYLYMSLPSCFDKAFYSNLRNGSVYLGTLDGLFCVSCTLSSGYFEVYVMEEYGVGESWIKKICIDMRNHFDIEKINILKFLDNGALVLKSFESPVVYYNTRKGTTSDVEAFIVEGFYTVVAHVPSLISLKDIVKLESVEKMERKWLHVFSSKAKVHTRKRHYVRDFDHLL